MHVEKFLLGEDLQEDIKLSIKLKLDRYSHNGQKLQEGEELFINLAEGLIQGILVHRDFQPLFINKAYADIFGYTSDEILQMESILPLIAPYERKRLVQCNKAHMRGDYAPARYEYQGIRRDGSPIWLDTRIWIVKWNGEEAILASALDTAQREQEEELRKSEEQFRSLSEAAFEGIVIHDRGKILGVNPMFVDMFGYDPSEIIGKNVIEFTVPESRDLFASHIFTDFEKHHESVCLRKDGSVFPAEICSKAIPCQGRALKSLAIRNLTERKQAEEELEKKHRESDILVKGSKIFTSSLEINEILYEVARLVSEEIGESCAIFKLREDHLLPITIYSNGKEDNNSFELLSKNPPSVNNCIYGISAVNKGPLFAEDVKSDHRFSKLSCNLLGDARSFISIPLIVGEEVLGVLSTSILKNNRRFYANDLKLTKALAEQATIALQNSNLREKTETFARRLSLVNEISKDVVNLKLMESVYRAIDEQLKRTFSFEFNIYVALECPEDDSIVFSHIYDPTGLASGIMEVDRNYPSDAVMLSKAIKEKRIIIYRSDNMPYHPESKLENHLISKGIRSILCIPIIVKEKCIGAFNLSAIDDAAFSEDEIKMLDAVASHLGNAINRAMINGGFPGVHRETESVQEKGFQLIKPASETVDNIQDSSSDKANIVKTLNEITFRANLLAVNAAVKIAQSGNAGEDFEAFAEEVRNLALSTVEAIGNIAKTVEDSVKEV